ncbi:MAG: M15 family metallopeptidase [Candidatus Aenigmarchaeota archaeon]|nr:M15 family metallopeptidase [Candidatus Aenigmarchaeota archaeon]
MFRFSEPLSELDKIIIRDNGELLTDISKACKHLFVRNDREKWDICPIEDPKARKFYLRKTVALMLSEAASFLPKNYSFLLLSAYRTIEEQKKAYERIMEMLKKEHPEWPYHVLRREANKYVHPPDARTPPGHCTGGAVDLTVCTSEGRPIDMTSPFKWPSPEAMKVSGTYSRLISGEARQNREILIKSMSGAGFTNYPGEWWHWSYGDSCWAYRLGKKVAIYGLARL